MYLLSGMVVLGIINNINARIVGQQQLSIEEVQRRKLARQKELARKPVYKMLDSLIVDQQGLEYVIKNNIDWPAIFHILDSMKGVISVNEYTAPDESECTLLCLAVEKNNLSATQTLLEKYKANPNKGEMTVLMIACENKNVPMVELLLKHGGDIYKKDPNGMDAIDWITARKFKFTDVINVLQVIAKYHSDTKVLKYLNLYKEAKSSGREEF
jgi:hypothetical protein